MPPVPESDSAARIARLTREVRSRASAGQSPDRIAVETCLSLGDVQAVLRDSPAGTGQEAAPGPGARRSPAEPSAEVQREIRERFDAEQTTQRIALDVGISVAEVFATLGIDSALPAEDVDWLILFPEGEEPNLRMTRGDDGTRRYGHRVPGLRSHGTER
ncbi:hypothetical protein [Brachybacterium hainanense]|uniref:Uncharacterized protein n=1 Tax=Brachybacterium hainanense TaxID=1541174 RepID=A0ABV6R6B1_9MICO